MTPTLFVLTDRAQAEARGRDLPTTVALAVDGGAPAILFREKDLPPGERAELGRWVAEACRPAALYVASDAELAESLDAAGVHLAAGDPWPAHHAGLEVGRSCHDAEDHAAAGEEGADYVTLSPVFTTASKPGYGPPLGLCRLAELAASGPPVVALGGITPETATACREAGAAGVAVMGAVMRAPDPLVAVLELRAAMEAMS